MPDRYHKIEVRHSWGHRAYFLDGREFKRVNRAPQMARVRMPDGHEQLMSVFWTSHATTINDLGSNYRAQYEIPRVHFHVHGLAVSVDLSDVRVASIEPMAKEAPDDQP